MLTVVEERTLVIFARPVFPVPSVLGCPCREWRPLVGWPGTNPAFKDLIGTDQPNSGFFY